VVTGRRWRNVHEYYKIYGVIQQEGVVAKVNIRG
jgi:hypothetical protein